VSRNEAMGKRTQLALSIQRNKVSRCNPHHYRSDHWDVGWIEVCVGAHARLALFVECWSSQWPILVHRPFEHHLFGDGTVAGVRELAGTASAVTHGKHYEKH
jgi:hypothetical protein